MINKFRKNQTMVFGLHPVLEAIKSDKELEKVLIQDGIRGETIHEIKRALNEKKIPYQYVPIEKIQRTCNGNHQGIIAFISEITYQPIEQVVIAAFESGKMPFFLILDRVTDVRNFGAIARVAECAGIDAIIVPKKETALITSDAIKTSAGALHRVNVCREDDLSETVRFLKNSGLTVFAATEKADKLIYDETFTKPLAIIMGAEDKGISHELLDLADEKIKIPLYGNIGSLNVSVATGIVLYEVLRQRNQR